jgi:hypothetical protein
MHEKVTGTSILCYSLSHSFVLAHARDGHWHIKQRHLRAMVAVDKLLTCTRAVWLVVSTQLRMVHLDQLHITSLFARGNRPVIFLTRHHDILRLSTFGPTPGLNIQLRLKLYHLGNG